MTKYDTVRFGSYVRFYDMPVRDISAQSGGNLYEQDIIQAAQLIVAHIDAGRPFARVMERASYFNFVNFGTEIIVQFISEHLPAPLCSRPTAVISVNLLSNKITWNTEDFVLLRKPYDWPFWGE